MYGKGPLWKPTDYCPGIKGNLEQEYPKKPASQIEPNDEVAADVKTPNDEAKIPPFKAEEKSDPPQKAKPAAPSKSAPKQKEAPQKQPKAKIKSAASPKQAEPSADPGDT